MTHNQMISLQTLCPNVIILKLSLSPKTSKSTILFVFYNLLLNQWENKLPQIWCTNSLTDSFMHAKP